MLEAGREAKNEHIRKMAVDLERAEAACAAIKDAAIALLDMIYPAEVFTGESGDPGALAVVRLRKACGVASGAEEAYIHNLMAVVQAAREWSTSKPGLVGHGGNAQAAALCAAVDALDGGKP
jgi:hypothetical protein